MKKKINFDSYKAFRFLKRFTICDVVITTIVTVIGYTSDIHGLKQAPIIGLVLYFACWVIINLFRELSSEGVNKEEK